MGVLSLFRLSTRSSKHQSPPPTLAQITPPSLQLHHNLQCPSAVFKAADVRLQHFLFEADQHSLSSEQEFSSTVTKLDAKRKSLRASRSKSRSLFGKRPRKKESQSHFDISSAQESGESTDLDISSADSLSRSQHREEWSGTASIASDKPRIRSKSYNARPTDASSKKQSYRDHRFSLTGLTLPPVIHQRERRDGSMPPRIPDYRHSHYFDPCRAREDSSPSPIDLASLSIKDLTVLQRTIFFDQAFVS